MYQFFYIYNISIHILARIVTFLLFLIASFLLFQAEVVANESKSGYIYFLQTEGEDSKVIPFFLSDQGQKYKIHESISPSQFKSGQRVKISGEINQQNSRRFSSDKTIDPISIKKLSIKEESDKEARSIPVGRKGFFLASISWPGFPAKTLSASNYTGLTNWSKAASNGRWTFSPITVRNITLPKQPSCNDEVWSRSTRQKITKLGFNLRRDYAALGLVIPDKISSNCVPTAYAYVDCLISAKYDNGNSCGLSVYRGSYSGVSTVAHELGHNLGLFHAQSLECLSGSNPMSLAYSTPCPNTEYGDVYDPMGKSFSLSMFNSFYSKDLGWLSSASGLQTVPLVGGTSRFTLNPYGSLQGKRALEIPLPSAVGKFSGHSPGKISVEYKGRSGVDENLYLKGSYCSALTPRNQLYLRYQPGFIAADNLNLSDYQSYLLDMTPKTSGKCDSGLTPGSSWQDPTGQLEISYKSLVNSIATVDVSVPSAAPATPFWYPDNNTTVYKRGNFISTVVNFTRAVSGISKEDVTLSGTAKNCKLRVYESYFATVSMDIFGCSEGTVRAIVRQGAGLDDTFLSVPTTPSSSANYVIDRTIVKPKLTSYPPKRTKRNWAQFKWAVSPDWSGQQCRLLLNRMIVQLWSKCSGYKKYNKLSKGGYTFSLRVKDRAGNMRVVHKTWEII